MEIEPRQPEEETNNFAIDVANIAENEWYFWHFNQTKWTKYSREIGDEAESSIRTVMINSMKPTVTYSQEEHQYLYEQNKSFLNAFVNKETAFPLDFFVVCYSKPIEEWKHLGLAYGHTGYYYLYSYGGESCLLSRHKYPDEFEIIFAYAIRQCDLMQLNSFLKYHLEANFDSDIKLFCVYLTQLERKLGKDLFTAETSASVRDWVQENKDKKFVGRKKLKTNLTVDKLAYLFKALTHAKLISDENKNDVISFAVEHFESKQQATISEGSFNSKFYSPDIDTLEYWKDQFNNLEKNTIREIQKLEKATR